MTPEGRLTSAIIRRLKSMNLWWVKLHGGPMQRAGLPDILIVDHGMAKFMELKAPAGRVSPLQEATMGELRRAGAEAVVIRSVEEFDLYFKKEKK